jgi:tetratricopeptide (TPR) repeat protein
MPVTIGRTGRLIAASGVLLALLATHPVRSQSPMACHAAESTVPATPPEKLPPPEHMAGVGNVVMPITTTAEAQAWFTQGVNLLHDFWNYEADRAFEQAIRVDPSCAMCYWGLYKSEGMGHSSGKAFAKAAIDKAVSLEKHASKAERLYIEAAAAEAAHADSGDHADNDKEVALLREVVRKYPHDTNARIFLAEALTDGYDDKGEPRAGQKEAIALLHSVLAEQPDNSAANHYWIHAVEASPHPEQALHSAEILGALAPTSGHMVHMPGHIFYRTGDYASAQKAFAASTAADERYLKAQHVAVDDDWNYVHNLMYSVANLLEAGRLKEATELSRKLTGARGQLEDTLYPWNPRDSISRIEPRLPVALRSGDWPRVVELAGMYKPNPRWPNLNFLAESLSSFAQGMQAVETHRVNEAKASSTLLDAALWRVSEQAKQEKKDKKKDDTPKTDLQLAPDALIDPLIQNLSIMSLELRASILTSENRAPEAEKLFAQAAQEEKDLGYREPPGYIRPVGETEAAALAAAGKYDDARAAYQRALKERPKSGFPLYGIAQSTEEAGDTRGAVAAYTDFVATWKTADPDLPQLTHARAYLAEHQKTLAGAARTGDPLPAISPAARQLMTASR